MIREAMSPYSTTLQPRHCDDGSLSFIPLTPLYYKDVIIHIFIIDGVIGPIRKFRCSHGKVRIPTCVVQGVLEDYPHKDLLLVHQHTRPMLAGAN